MYTRSSLRKFKHLRKLSKLYFTNTQNIKYKQPTSQEIINYLKSNNLNPMEKFSGGITTEICPLCPKPHNNDKTNLWTLNFKENSGLYMCFRCGSSGHWNQFKKLLGDEEIDTYKKPNSNINTFYRNNFSESYYQSKMETQTPKSNFLENNSFHGGNKKI